MLASVGAGVSNVTSNPVHASRISTLRNRMNNDYKKSSHYNRQVKMIKREIARLSHNNKASKAYRQGYLDGAIRAKALTSLRTVIVTTSNIKLATSKVK